MNVDLHPVNTISLFTGSGMLDVAVDLALEQFGMRTRPLCYVERDSAAAAVVVAFMEAKAVGEAPIWDEIETFDGGRFRRYMADGIVLASVPCQPYSSAGKRIGNSDHRSHGEDGDGPIPQCARIIEECGPALAFFECVPEWITAGWFRPFGDALCRMGYTIEDPLFVAAEDVGAPHRRERVFVLAVADAAYGRGWDRKTRRGARRSDVAGADQELALPSSAGRKRPQWRGTSGEQEPAPRRSIAELRGELGDAECAEPGTGTAGIETGARRGRGRSSNAVDQLGNASQQQPAGYGRRNGRAARNGDGPAQSCTELPLFPPGRGDEDDPDHPDWWAWAAIAEMGHLEMFPRIESSVFRLAHGHPISRADLLRIAGNAVCPSQAAVAFAHLFARAMAERQPAIGDVLPAMRRRRIG